ncbi:hypothetical protein E4T38_05708 [Aureobasidium subglaciale]|nr:hypothetical protein E4T38_05708 [Aureobasidium subglaciale]KAI5221091.1 hypothetical protein E4T40_05654 [Aureobasidium subglaciale]KAI5224318.1 hypothetical protein E4T41_05687 [Aureobasidium subglaciale]KAI5261038.1 hypothetical protein E4T46_05462 [Aureobasidium subglaciale]
MASTMTSDPKTIVPVIVTITDSHDVVLRVTEYDNSGKVDKDGKYKIKTIVDFQATRQNLIDVSPVFKTLLTTRNFAEAGQYIINLKEHVPEAIEVILCAIYGKDSVWEASATGQEVALRTLKLEPIYLWEVMDSNHSFMIEFHNLDAWFTLWYKSVGLRFDADVMMYPCFQFRHAEGFLRATKAMVYHYHHIKERGNSKHNDLCLPPRVLQQVRAALGRVKTVLTNEIWFIIDKMLLSAFCGCKERVLFAFQLALKKTEGFPIDRACQGDSIQNVIRKLQTFDKHFKLPADCCRECRRNWFALVKGLCRVGMDYFDGLCLDCMDHSKANFPDSQSEAADHLVSTLEWDYGCSVKHGQASWYFSFSTICIMNLHITNTDTPQWLSMTLVASCSSVSEWPILVPESSKVKVLHGSRTGCSMTLACDVFHGEKTEIGHAVMCIH